ncbi:3-oxoacyl-[acyl-carrier protein] reductase [Runella defluvii]|uniref:3-oxoacyl-[acyl-carrier protein] reductase n=1 Tax=Runella defluvii TaxID=370973 RepID=A0A7W6ES70_9BACT|nr:SDR family oxidoreductase [Runella defluvii]MBB3840405.1 3-oxoacyl-[acyl-carrier protein] reductase [Runella defluvii]
MKEKEFSGQVAIVTGAGQGIGLEIARQLAERGAAVVLNDLDQTLSDEGALAIQQQGGNCISYPGNAADVDFVQAMVAEAVKVFGKLTTVVANAGMTTFGDFFEYRPESLQQLLDLNIRGSFFLTQAAARQMRLQGQGGRVLLMSSVTGHQAHQFLAAYGMTKAALEMLAKSLVVELSPYGITINAVAPGATMTERTAEDPAYNQTWSKITPMGRPATVQDIANAALFLVSPGAGHVTGQSLVVDGGWTSVSPSPYHS